MTDAEGRPVGALIILDDVTRLRQLESIRSDFAANVSHELRTPITNIQGYVETLLDGGSTEGEQSRHFLNVVRQNCNRLAAIIRGHPLARPAGAADGGRHARPPDATRSPGLLSNVAEQFAGAAEAKAMTIECKVPDGCP